MKYIAIIPARKGSKRIKNKNIIKLNNKKLIDYTIDAAVKCKKIYKIVVSTNIKKLLKRKNTKKIIYLKRSELLSKDNTTTEKVIIDVVKKNLNIFFKSNIVILQATSPLRNSLDIYKSIKKFEDGNYDSLFSAHTEKFYIWKYFGKKIKSISYNPKKRKRSQFLKENFFENGAIYISKTKNFLKKKCRLFNKIGVYEMPKLRSLEIDEKSDLDLINFILKKNMSTDHYIINK